jgi:hypothetical protein
VGQVFNLPGAAKKPTGDVWTSQYPRRPGVSPQGAAKGRFRRKLRRKAEFRRRLRRNSARGGPEGDLSTRRRKGLRLMLHARSEGAIASASRCHPKRKHGHLLFIEFSKIGPSGVRAAAVAACGWSCEVAVLQADLPFLLSFSRYPQSLTVGCNEGVQLRGGGACAICLLACPSAFRAAARPRCVHLYTRSLAVSRAVPRIAPSRRRTRSCVERMARGGSQENTQTNIAPSEMGRACGKTPWRSHVAPAPGPPTSITLHL